MKDLNLPIMLTYRCPARHVGRVRNLLQSHQADGVRFEERAPAWWERWLGGGSTFTIRYPEFFAEELQFHLSGRRWVQASTSAG